MFEEVYIADLPSAIIRALLLLFTIPNYAENTWKTLGHLGTAAGGWGHGECFGVITVYIRNNTCVLIIIHNSKASMSGEGYKEGMILVYIYKGCPNITHKALKGVMLTRDS